MVRDDDAPDGFEDEPTHLDQMQPLGERQTSTYKTAEFLETLEPREVSEVAE